MPIDIRALFNYFFTRTEELRSEAANHMPECVASRLASLASFFAPLRSCSSSLLAKATQKPFQTGALAAVAVGAVALLILGYPASQEEKKDLADKALDDWVNAAPTEEEKGSRCFARGSINTYRKGDQKEFFFLPSALTSLPDEISSFTNMTKLSIQSNSFEIVPSAIRKLTNLKSIDLSENQIKEIPDWIGELTQLKKIYLSGNQLTSLPNSLSALQNLELLVLSGNRFEEIPQLDIPKKATLYIDIMDQQETFPGEPEDSGREPIHFSGTYESVCRRYKAYQKFITELKSWVDEARESEEYTGRRTTACLMRECYKKVKDLEQYPKKWTDDSSNGAFQYRDLEEKLDLSNLQLTSLPRVFSELSGIQFQSGAKFYGVTTLKLEGNRFSEFPEVVSEIKGLQYLYLWGNPITNLPADLPKKLVRLRLIHVCIDTLESEVPDSFTKAKILHTKETPTEQEYKGREFKVNLILSD